jgi:hypothetical protein
MGLTMKEYKDASAATHFKRGARFLWPGSGANRENMLNSVGLLAKHQKRLGGFNSFFTRNMIPLGFAAAAIGTVAAGGSIGDIGTNIAMEIGFMSAFRPAKEVGHGIGKMLGMGRTGSYATGLISGTGVGLVAAAAAAGIAGSTSNNNAIQRTGSRISRASTHGSGITTRDTLTNRQAVLQKLAKSGLNNRGQLLGNEASIIKGVL